LQFSIEHKNKIGEIEAYMQLGICEEHVYNINNAMQYLEIALNKAVDISDKKCILKVSKELMRVYETIAGEYEASQDYETSLLFYEKCLSATKNAKDIDKEAQCYYKIGIIREKMEDLEESVVNVNHFLDLVKERQPIDKKKIGRAHNKLAELNSKLGYGV